MSKLYAIRQTKYDKYWYDFVEDFASSELDRNCISNNFAYVKECQNTLGDLNPAWKNSEIVEFRELGEKDDFEDLYYKSLEQRADLEAKLAESEDKNKKLKDEVCKSNVGISHLKNQLKQAKEENKKLIKALNGEVFINYKVPMENAQLKQQLAEKENRIGQLETGIRKIEDNKNKEVQQIREFWKQRYKKLDDNSNQDKIEFAIDELEKVKELFESCWDYHFDIGELCNKELFYEKIDNQIKAIKGEEVV